MPRLLAAALLMVLAAWPAGAAPARDCDAVVRQILAEKFKLRGPQATPDSDFADDMKLDAAKHAALIAAVEKEFGIRIPPDQAEQMITFGDLSDLLKAAVPACR